MQVLKKNNYTRNEWRTLKSTLETSVFLAPLQRLFFKGKLLNDDEILSGKKLPPTGCVFMLVRGQQNGWEKTTLETSGEDVKLHSKRVGKM